MSDVFEQALLNKDSHTIEERLMSSEASSKHCNPTRAATKSIREAKVASSGSVIKTSQAGKKTQSQASHREVILLSQPNTCMHRSHRQQ
jgi:hypothetical protein